MSIERRSRAERVLHELFFEKLSIEKMLVDLVRSSREAMLRDHTGKFVAAYYGEIDILAPHEVDDDVLEELDDWSEIGWVLLECGCLVGPEGRDHHGPAVAHLENEKE